MATGRPSTVSHARKTVAIPPRPTSSSRRKRPASMSPGSAMRARYPGSGYHVMRTTPYMFEVARVSQVSGEVPHRPRCVRGATKPGNHVECLGGHDETVRTEHGSRRIEGPVRGGR